MTCLYLYAFFLSHSYTLVPLDRWLSVLCLCGCYLCSVILFHGVNLFFLIHLCWCSLALCLFTRHTHLYPTITSHPIPLILFSSHVSQLHCRHRSDLPRIAAVAVFIVLESILDLCLYRLPVPSLSLSSSLSTECWSSCCFWGFS